MEDAIKFTHDGVEYIFKTAPNPLVDAQMWWFEPQASMYAGPKSVVKKLIKNILAKGGERIEYKRSKG